jgi:hypothetical protein
MINSYFNNPENLSCLIVLKTLYSDVVKNSPEKKSYISQNFMVICDFINKNVYQMKKNQIELIDIYSQLVIKVLDTLEFLIVDEEKLNSMLDLFMEALKTISEPNLNKNLIRALTKIITDKKIPREISNNKYGDIVYTVFYSCDHYESSSILDVIFNYLIEFLVYYFFYSSFKL